MRSLLLLATIVGAACRSNGPRAADAAPMASDAHRIDATPGDAGLCAPDTSCPCFDNYDCPSPLACVSQDDSGEHVYCEHSPRGTGAAGVTCTGQGDCASALCVDDGAGGMKCSDICSGPSQCPASLPSCTDISVAQICLPN